jgi:two-component system, NarL family, nitrate/nitrite response regulator NarL
MKMSPGRIGLVLVGISTGSQEDLDYVRQIASASRDYKVVVVAEISNPAEQPDIGEIVRCGADAYVINVHSRDVLLKTLELVVLEQHLVVVGKSCEPLIVSDGYSRQQPSGAGEMLSLGSCAAGLSERELEILGCLAGGASNKHIGRRFKIAESTVKIHLRSILRKIQAKNRTQAAIWAVQNGVSLVADQRGEQADETFVVTPDLFVAEVPAEFDAAAECFGSANSVEMPAAPVDDDHLFGSVVARA